MPATDESTFSFDTGGDTHHITQSRGNVAKYAPPGMTAPDGQGAIGSTPDGVDGVDITVPTYQFSETHFLANAVVTGAHKATRSAACNQCKILKRRKTMRYCGACGCPNWHLAELSVKLWFAELECLEGEFQSVGKGLNESR